MFDAPISGAISCPGTRPGPKRISSGVTRRAPGGRSVWALAGATRVRVLLAASATSGATMVFKAGLLGLNALAIVQAAPREGVNRR
ncbi:MAG: hypothetical protein U1E86_27225 [Burkholderiaceae bacterium]